MNFVPQFCPSGGGGGGRFSIPGVQGQWCPDGQTHKVPTLGGAWGFLRPATHELHWISLSVVPFSSHNRRCLQAIQSHFRGWLRENLPFPIPSMFPPSCLQCLPPAEQMALMPPAAILRTRVMTPAAIQLQDTRDIPLTAIQVCTGPLHTGR